MEARNALQVKSAVFSIVQRNSEQYKKKQNSPEFLLSNDEISGKINIIDTRREAQGGPYD
jgi:hypothetical protein